MNLARSAAAALLVTALFVPLPAAEARPGKGLSQGSRGLKTYQAPPSTRTAPTTAQPMQRSATPQPGTTQPGVGATQAARPGAATAAAGAAQTSRFGGGFMAGLLGAGLIGGLLGAGFFGGLGSLTSILGFVLQIALIGGIAYLAYALLFRRRQPAAVGPQGGLQGGLQDAMQRNNAGPGGMNAGPGTPARPVGGSRIGSAIGGSAAAATMGATAPLTIDGGDYASFERLLSVVQLAYGREDRDALRSAVTTEMLGYFAEELDANAANGVRNELGEPKLLSGDLAEAWAEASGEYATVAMHYALTDAMVDRATGKVVEGSRTEPQDGTELWTFVRRPGSGPAGWRLSAIQQTA